MGLVEIVDASTQRLTRQYWRDHPEKRGLIQNLWPGGWGSKGVYRANAPANLYDALMEGRSIHGYMAVTPDQPTAWYGHDYFDEAMAEATLRAGDCWGEIGGLWSDLETFEDPPGSKNFYWPTERLALSWTQRMALLKPTGVYSARWFTDAYYGQMSNEWLKYPAWGAWYSVPPSLDWGFGPWAKVVGHQYGGDGGVDYNVFDASFFGGDMPSEAEIKGWIADAAKGVNDRVDMLLAAYDLTAEGLKHMASLVELVLAQDYAGLRQYLDDHLLGVGK